MLVENDRDYEIEISHDFEFFEGGPTLLLDGDPIAYSSAAACDQSIHKILLKDTVIYELTGGVTDLYNALGFTDYRDFGQMLEKNPDITYDKEIVSDNPQNMLHTVKSQIKKIIKTVEAGALKLYLTDGESNFRLTEEIATILKYKGNRSPDAKPTMLGEARKYMIEELGATLCVGLEADDQLAIDHRAAWKQAMIDAEHEFCDDPDYLAHIRVNERHVLEKKAMELTTTVLASIDKDLKMCAGKYINPDQDLGVEEIYPLGNLYLEKKGKGKNETNKLRFSGLKGFYSQILLGDNCDNIPRVYFAGDKRVFELLDGCKNEEELFKATLTEIYHGFKREHVKANDAEINKRVELALASGSFGKDTAANRTKVRKKIKDAIIANSAYPDKHYYHWSEFKLAEDGTVSKELACENPKVLTITPLDYMIQVARLIYMLEVAPNKEGTHLWTPPNEDWVKEVVSKFEVENLTKIPMAWPMEG